MQPSKFEFILIEGSAGASYALRLEGNMLKYLKTPPDHKEQGFGLDRIHRFTPSEGEQRDLVVADDQWEKFYQDIDELGIWAWEAHYDDPNVMQGFQWSIHFTFEDKEIRCGGANAYPGAKSVGYSAEFKKLLAATNKLLTCVEFGS